ncbi:MAG: hypothetical protein C4617_04530 [Candidatus Liberibacter europaeus]|uniref:Uncharacterized protein n=1 Tax=Candidatus Liberibacter europaeus TaxID=744859 RepID=A0A2T4VWW4_9HYPH|nr:hypothetical protein [Candidatus Liberibacter europaeus]PTL86275.1 MAG: hypothetical protein C4617_04530 [Candidatus Liberibacter europaeus]
MISISEDKITNKSSIDVNSQSVQLHLTFLQNVISRMASNSSSMKTWCISILSAILIFAAKAKIPHMYLVALINIGAFWIMDAKYLALEKGFRASYNHFVNKIHNKTLKEEDLFILNLEKISFIDTTTSFSVFPFYMVLLLGCFLTHWWLS